MRLADFIQGNRERILAEWEAFARTCAPASVTMSVAALRDHADQMLTAIAADLRAPQAAMEQSEKSKGRAPIGDSAPATAAEEHGADRAESGFTLDQMAAEYRALRASVIRLWTEGNGGLGSAEVEDLIRFNEAIDQSLGESVTRYSQHLGQSREKFLAILGHDLRTPLGAIYTSARFMLDLNELEEPHRTLTERIAHSASRAVRMVGDLLDFTRSRLGGGIPIVRAEMDLGRAVRDAADEISAAHPGHAIQVDPDGPQRGAWDEPRIRQALGNLIGNAVQHGMAGSPVTVVVRGEEDHVTVAIHNHGPPIPADQLPALFDPIENTGLLRKVSGRGPTASLGLGLHIAERIVSAHGGRIDVASSEAAGTTVTVWLPRHEAERGSAPSEGDLSVRRVDPPRTEP